MAGETPEECVIREVKEESGYQIYKPMLKGILTFPAFSNNEDWYCFLFTATDFDGVQIESPEGRLQWVPDDELLSLNLWEGDRIFLPWLDQPRFFSGKFLYQNGILTKHDVIFYGV